MLYSPTISTKCKILSSQIYCRHTPAVWEESKQINEAVLGWIFLTWSNCEKYLCAASLVAACGLTTSRDHNLCQGSTIWWFLGTYECVLSSRILQCSFRQDMTNGCNWKNLKQTEKANQTKPNLQQNQPTKNKNREEESGNKRINGKNNCLYHSVIPNLMVIKSSGATEKEENIRLCSNSLYHHHLDHEN